MSQPTAIFSLLHEGISPHNSATRLFRDRPVLAWTLERLRRSRQVGATALICWEDQREAVNEIAGVFNAQVVVKRPRTAIAALDRISAAQRWSDGWRGGLLGTCYFDQGFYAPFVQEALAGKDGDLILLVDPAAALVDPDIIDAIVAHAIEHPHREFFFTQAAPGLAGVMLRPALLDRLASAGTHPGRLLTYSPDTPGLDPITNDMCVAVPAAIARTGRRFLLDSERQIRRFTAATADLNGALIGSDAERILAILDAHSVPDNHPREVVLEVTARRGSRPIFAPATHMELGRGDIAIESVERVLAELSGIDDLRLTLAGAGDPLLHPRFPEILKLIKQAGVPAIHVETDLLALSAEAAEAIIASRIDIVSVHLPAATAATYKRVMGIDGFTQALENLKRLLNARSALPLIVPTFTKCRENLDEMEPWYDHWLRVLGIAVITGPTNYAGLIPDHGAADMSPPRRRPCTRLQTRMTLHSDGVIPSCEQDVLAKQTLGHAMRGGVTEAWRQPLLVLRNEHHAGTLESRPVCAACSEWHRP